MKRKPKRIRAWAAVGKNTGRILHDFLIGRYAIYNNRHEAHCDCPDYGIVRQVEIHVINGASNE